MLHYLIVCKSLTYAQRTAKELEKAGITALVIRPPAEISGEGCAYAVRVTEKNLASALTVIKNAGLGRGKVYMTRDDGRTSEVGL